MAEGANPLATSPSGTASRPARRSIRVPILAVVLIVAACAMAFAALRTASEAWHEATYTFTVFLLLFAVLASRFRRGDEQAFWLGFAAFGWGFFILGYWPGMRTYSIASQPGQLINPNLLTSRLIFSLLPILRKPTYHLGMIDPITLVTLSIAHLVATLIVGLIGGGLALLLRRRSRGRISVNLLALLTGLMLVAAVAVSIEVSSSTVRYFPPGSFDEPEDSPDFPTARYSKHLAAMGESSLWSLSRHDRQAAVYRLLWLPSFHHPVCVRIERTGDGARLRATVLDGKGGYEPGRVAIERSVELGRERWDRLEEYLEVSAFWDMRTIDPSSEDILDGSQFVVEGAKDGRYHIVDRCDPGPLYEAACRYMLALTNLDISSQWEDFQSPESPDDQG